MKVIFLDIDGVLNTESYITAVWDVVERMDKISNSKNNIMEYLHDQYGSLFDPMAIRFLKHICDQTGAKIVISSTWRHSGLGEMQDMWKHRNLPSEVIGITPDHSRKTGSTLQRGKEIAEWLSEHTDVESYVIIDDDADMESEQFRNFVNTDPQYGLTKSDAKKAIEILST